MDDEAEGWERVGTHLLRVEEPDIIHFRNRGDVLPADTARMVEEIRKLSRAKGSACLISDISRLGNIPPSSRKVAAGSDVFAHLEALAVVGGAFHQRLIATITVTAARLRQGGGGPVVRFFATEAEARAWVEQLRPGPRRAT